MEMRNEQKHVAVDGIFDQIDETHQRVAIRGEANERSHREQKILAFSL